MGDKAGTTAEELEAFYIIKAILRKKIDVERVNYRDAQSYFSVLLDDNNRKPICRIQLTGNKKYITLFDEDRKGIRKELTSIDNIYDLADQLVKTIDILEKGMPQE